MAAALPSESKAPTAELVLGPHVVDLAARCTDHVEFYRTFTGSEKIGKHMILCFRCVSWDDYFLKCELIGSDGPLGWACQVKAAPMEDWSPPTAPRNPLKKIRFWLALQTRTSSHKWEPAALAELITAYCTGFGSYSQLFNNCRTFAYGLTLRGRAIGKRFHEARSGADPKPVTAEEAEVLLRQNAVARGVELTFNKIRHVAGGPLTQLGCLSCHKQ
jgi:hypothetical protein